MHLKEIQDWTREAWKKSKKQVDEKLELIFLMEEIGELAEAIRKTSGQKDNKDIDVDLEKEIGDILLSLVTLAIRYDVDLESAFEKVKKDVEKRYM